MHKSFLEQFGDLRLSGRGRRPDDDHHAKPLELHDHLGHDAAQHSADKLMSHDGPHGKFTGGSFRMRPYDQSELRSSSGFLRRWAAYRMRIVVVTVAAAAICGVASLPADRHKSDGVTDYTLVGAVQSAIHYAVGSQGQVLRSAPISIPEQPAEYFLPWRRSDVAHIVRAWHVTPQVAVSPYNLPATSRYELWKERANLIIAGINGQGQGRRAGLLESWLGRNEAHAAWTAAGNIGPEPPKAGPEPRTLSDGAGMVPQAAFRGLSLQYVCRLPGVSRTFVFHDHPVDPDYPFLLNPFGVADEGTRLANRKDLTAIFQQARIDDAAAQILRTVSLREGGFEAVNTYDTGYVSVGFIQFTTMQSGRGSLIAVLSHMKDIDPKEYEHYFHSFGIDVDDSGQLTVIDPSSGEVLRGADAVQRVIADKRLTAVFYHAGIGSRWFQVAQVEQARSEYFAPEHTFDVPVASVTDYTHPDRPVKTYYYGVDAIGKAQQFVDAMNAQPWTPPRRSAAGLAPLVLRESRELDSVTAPPPHMQFHRCTLSRTAATQPSKSGSKSDSGKPGIVTLNDVQPPVQAAVNGASTTEPDLSPRYDDADAPHVAQARNTPISHSHLPKLPSAAAESTIPSVSSIKPLADIGKPPQRAIPFGGAGINAAEFDYHGPHYVMRSEPNLVGTYGRIFKSGAGQTAIVDRCVQHGFDYGQTREGLAAKFEDSITAVAKGKLVTLHDLAVAERDLIPVVQNRIDVLHVAQLTQPGEQLAQAQPAMRRTHSTHHRHHRGTTA